MIAKSEWVLCPICNNKTRVQIREDTELLSLFHLKRLLNWDCPIIKRGRTILTATF